MFAEYSRTYPEVDVQRSTATARCLSHTHTSFLLLFIRGPQLKRVPLVAMSVLCYNKGCGQRFDPEKNPEGE